MLPSPIETMINGVAIPTSSSSSSTTNKDTIESPITPSDVLSSNGKDLERQTVVQTDAPGGLRAWLVVLGGFLDFSVAFGLMNSFGTFQAVYETHWQVSSSTVTWIGSVQLFLTFLGGLVFGPAFDRYGARKIMLPGTLICLISFIATSFATHYYQFLLAQGILFGIGNAMLFYPATGAISEWFTDKRGLALGLALSGASVGGIFWPIIIGRLFNTVSGPWVHRILAIISIPILLGSCFLVKERKGNNNNHNHNHNANITNHNNSTSIIGDSSLASLASQEEQVSKSTKKVVFEVRFLTLCASLFFIYGGMLIPFYYIPLFAIEKGVDPIMANNLLSIGYAGSVIGRVASGWIADRVGRFNILIAVATFTGIVTACWVSTTTFGAMIAATFFFCLFSGGLIPLGSACVAQTTTDMQYIGLCIGVMMTICSIAALGGGPISGYIKDNGGGWIGCYAFSAGSTIMGALMLLAVRFLNQPRWNVAV